MHSFWTYSSAFSHQTKKTEVLGLPLEVAALPPLRQARIPPAQPQFPAQTYQQAQPLSLSWAGEAELPLSAPVVTHRCTRGYSTPGSPPRALCTRSRHGPPPCTAGSAAVCRWSRSPSTGSTSSTPATDRRLPRQARKRWTQQSYHLGRAEPHLTASF